MSIQRISLSALAIVVIAGTAYLFNPWYPPQLPGWLSAADNSSDPEIATVAGMGIRKSELIPYLQDLASSQQLLQWGSLESIPPDVYETALLNLAQDKLVRQVADEAELTERPEVKALMEKSANRIAKLTYLEQLAPQLVNEENVKQRYTELADSLRGKTEYRARHILLKDEKEANTIIKALKKRPFDELARLFSLDEKTGLRGGDLGYVLPGTLDPEFEAAVAKLKIGKVSKPFQTRFGWHIAIVEDRREARPMAFEQAQPIIRRQLEQQAAKDWLDELVANAEIKTLLVNKPDSSAQPALQPTQ